MNKPTTISFEYFYKNRLMKTIFLSMMISVSVFGKAQTSSDTLTARAIIEKYIEKIGGKEYLQGIQTLYTSLNTEMEGREVEWIVKEMKPNKGSFEISYKGNIVYRSFFNGKKGYEVDAKGSKKSDSDKHKDKLFKKHIINELDYLDSTIYTLQLLGEQLVNEERCYKIKVILKNGAVSNCFYSISSFLLVKDEKTENAEAERYTVTYFSKYKKFGQLYYPSELVVVADGHSKKLVVKKVAINESVFETDFKL